MKSMSVVFVKRKPVWHGREPVLKQRRRQPVSQKNNAWPKNADSKQNGDWQKRRVWHKNADSKRRVDLLKKPDFAVKKKRRTFFLQFYFKFYNTNPTVH